MPDHLPRPATPGRLVAHRGASLAAPENTLAAFAAARGLGIRWVEFDVSLLGDGTAVVHHDATLERCTDTAGPLSAIERADLARIGAGRRFGGAWAGEPIPTLTATLDFLEAAGMSANLEMKPQGADPGPLAETVAGALAERDWTRAQVLVASFSAEALAALAPALPGQPLALLVDAPEPGWPEHVAALGAGALHMNWRRLAPAHLEAAEASGLDLRVYTANEPEALAPLRRPGLTGVITDDPAAFLAVPDWAAWALAPQAAKRP